MDRSRITVTAPGLPQGKGRARSFIRGAHIGHYTPEKTRTHEGLIRSAALDQLGARLNSRWSLVCALTSRCLASWSRRKQQLAIAGDKSGTSHDAA